MLANFPTSLVGETLQLQVLRCRKTKIVNASIIHEQLACQLLVSVSLTRNAKHCRRLLVEIGPEIGVFRGKIA